MRGSSSTAADASLNAPAAAAVGSSAAIRRARSSPTTSRVPGADTALDAALRIDSQIMLVDDPVKRVDNMTMAWGLEARVPFLDHELVELAALCPPELKLAGGGKGVLEGGQPQGASGRGHRPARRATSRCRPSATCPARCSSG